MTTATGTAPVKAAAAPRKTAAPAVQAQSQAVGSLNWVKIEVVEFDTLSDIWMWCGTGAGLARETGMAVLQAKADFQAALGTIDADPRSGRRKAASIARRLNSVANHFAGIKNDFERIPAQIMKVYAEEIDATRRKTRPRIDLSK